MYKVLFLFLQCDTIIYNITLSHIILKYLFCFIFNDYLLASELAIRSQSKLYLLNQLVTELSNTRLASNSEAFGLFCHLNLTENQPI